jgi:hypothetical protein
MEQQNDERIRTMSEEITEAQWSFLRDRRDAWRSALQSLTPGGSEFTEPQECERYVKNLLNERWEAIKRMKIQQDTLAALLREVTTSIEFDELGLGSLDERIRRVLVP